jgi:hypothetical protein
VVSIQKTAQGSIKGLELTNVDNFNKLGMLRLSLVSKTWLWDVMLICTRYHA